MAATKKLSGATAIAAQAAISAMPPQIWLSPSHAAAYLGCLESRLAKMRKDGKGPRFFKAPGRGGAVSYQKADLDEWLAANP